MLQYPLPDVVIYANCRYSQYSSVYLLVGCQSTVVVDAERWGGEGLFVDGPQLAAIGRRRVVGVS